jgi:hypothetical protein
MQIDWLRSEISAAAAILRASQRVSMAVVNSLRPAIRYDPEDLRQWESEAANLICLSTMLLSVKEEAIPKPQKSAARAKIPKMAACSGRVGRHLIQGSPRSDVVIARQRSPGPMRPIIRPNRSIRA